jgi:hypothetical protein
VRLRGMTPTERQTALRSLAHLLLEASGIAPQETDDEQDAAALSLARELGAVLVVAEPRRGADLDAGQ